MKELWEITETLEKMDDEVLAVTLLTEFNDKTRVHHLLLQNTDPDLDHEEWKRRCRVAQREVDGIVKRILTYQR